MFTCTRKKDSFKNLTVGKEYDGTEDGESLIVVNDAGFRARYSKEYFRSTDAPRRGRPPRVQEVVAAAPPPPPPPPPVLRDIVTVEITRNDNNISVQLVQAGVLRNNEHRFSISMSGCTISCGIYQASGISGVGFILNEFLNSLPENTVDRSINNLTAIVMSRLMEYVKQNFRAAFWIWSDATDEEDAGYDSAVHQWLTDNAAVSTLDINPNSDNTITLWVLGSEGGE